VNSKESDEASIAAVRWSEKIMIDNASSIKVTDSAPAVEPIQSKEHREA
jgi:hypothetical protein